MTRAYVDSSVLLAILLREAGSLSWVDEQGELITSDLTELECRRTLDRIRIQENLGNEEVAERYDELRLIMAAIRVIKLDAPVLKRAKAQFPTVVRTLDAIHLASAELAGATSFISRDQRQVTAARGMGFQIHSL